MDHVIFTIVIHFICSFTLIINQKHVNKITIKFFNNLLELKARNVLLSYFISSTK